MTKLHPIRLPIPHPTDTPRLTFDIASSCALAAPNKSIISLCILLPAHATSTSSKPHRHPHSRTSYLTHFPFLLLRPRSYRSQGNNFKQNKIQPNQVHVGVGADGRRTYSLMCSTDLFLAFLAVLFPPVSGLFPLPMALGTNTSARKLTCLCSMGKTWHMLR